MIKFVIFPWYNLEIPYYILYLDWISHKFYSSRITIRLTIYVDYIKSVHSMTLSVGLVKRLLKLYFINGRVAMCIICFCKYIDE